MRETTFRGKRKDNGEWVYGYLIKRPDVIHIGDYSPWYILVPPADPEDSGGFYNVEPDTVGQYTGLTDISGTKIFEGDIMRTAVSGLQFHTGIVEFSDGAFGLKCLDGNGFFLCFVAGSYQVIDNIHNKMP